MDYKRVYAEFIKDRRAKEPALVGYVERHHIVPRRLGGTEDVSNLIDLTAGDHFFAHLLLARIYGGRAWVPVVLWCGGQKGNWRAGKSRRNYEWLAQVASRHAGGQNAYQYDWTIYRLERDDGATWSGTQEQMHSLLRFTRSQANRLVKRQVGSAYGWYHSGERPPFVGHVGGGKLHHMYRHEEMHFCHVDGREFKGTQHDFHLHTGVSKSAACMLARGKYRCVNGWHLKGAEFAKVGKGSRWRKHVGQLQLALNAI